VTTINTSNASSGIDVESIVSQLIETERAPERLWKAQQQLLQLQASAPSDLNSKLGSLDSSVDSLRDISGAFAQNLVTSSNASVVSATAASDAAAGQHLVAVSSLATRSSFYSDPLASGSTPISSGSFQLQVGSANAVTVTVDAATNSLDKLAAKINAVGMAVSASVVNDANGARLALVGTQTGKANDLTISAITGFAFTRSSSAENAKLTVDGIPIESASNQVQGAIQGITLDLVNTSVQSVVLQVAPDTARVSQAVQSLVNNYNSLIKTISAQFSYDSTNKTSGPLSGDSCVRSLQEELLKQVSYSTDKNGGIASLYSLGITVQNDGTLLVDSAKLSNQLQSDFAHVKSFFQGTNANGFANSFASIMDRLNDSVEGPLVVDLKGNSNSQKSLQRQIDDFEVRIVVRHQQLLEQYSRVDAILRQFPLTQNQLTAQLNSLTNNK
jgi:flagellar hook-associated protein 2